jgi:hypothetical protein
VGVIVLFQADGPAMMFIWVVMHYCHFLSGRVPNPPPCGVCIRRFFHRRGGF